MPSLKDIRSRIGSVKKTKQITAAMKLVAAAKLKGAKVTIDGASVSVPGQKAISTGIHTFKAYKEGVIDLECRLVASGADISIVVDPDAPKCP